MEVSAVNGTTITFDTPLTYPFHTAYAAQLTTYTGEIRLFMRRRTQTLAVADT